MLIRTAVLLAATGSVAAQGNYLKQFHGPLIVTDFDASEQVRFGDVNGDGHVDAVFLSYDLPRILRVYLMDQDAFRESPFTIPHSADTANRSIELFDADNDGDLDLMLGRATVS